MMNYNLNFVEYDVLKALCQTVMEKLEISTKEIEKDLHSNIIDPFSAIFEASFQKIPLSEWIEKEKNRQVQKSFQNEIGVFHQKLLGSFANWENLGTGKVVDLVNRESKIIAEVKNKFNTTKGNHKIAIYDDFDNLLKGDYKDYTAYYVAILAKKRFNNSFTPSDNKAKQRRLINEKIREIDGASFYELASGETNAIEKLYKILPFILAEITNHNEEKIIKDPLFEELFKKAFK
jgi:hypothetical protein